MTDRISIYRTIVVIIKTSGRSTNKKSRVLGFRGGGFHDEQITFLRRTGFFVCPATKEGKQAYKPSHLLEGREEQLGKCEEYEKENG